MADNDASVTRRATLSTLPLEIKSRICELAALQDERYQERWIPGALGEKLIEVHKNAWRGRSLAALSETSREFNELAAKHIFHTLTDGQIDSFEFTLIVLPKHTSRVRCVNIERSLRGRNHLYDFRPIFAVLTLLPNLSELRVNHDAVFDALGDLLEEPDDGGESMLNDAFRPVARRLRKAVLVDFPTMDDVAAFSAMCGTLSDLTIEGHHIFDEPEDLGEHLSSIPTLERLTLHARRRGTQGLRLLTSEWPTLPLLSSLDLVDIELEANSIALINQHALTLRHLMIQLPNDSPPTPPTGFPPFNNLPLLSSFTLQNSSSDTFESVAAAIVAATQTNSDPAESRLDGLAVQLKDSGMARTLTGGYGNNLLPFFRLPGPGNHLASTQKDAFLSPHVAATCAYCRTTVEFLPPPPLDARTTPTSYKIECASCGLRFLLVQNIAGKSGETFPLPVHLPPELISHIISLMRDDMSTLDIHTAALVSHLWNACATPILYGHIRVDWWSAKEEILPLFTQNSERSRFLRSLILEFDHLDYDEDEEDRGDAAEEPDARKFVDLVARTPLLGHLQLRNMDVGAVLGSALGQLALSTNLPSVRKLEVTENRTVKPARLPDPEEPSQQALVTMASNLEELHITYLRIKVQPQVALVNLTTLRLDYLEGKDLESFHAFTEHSTPNLRNLFVNKYLAGDIGLGQTLSRLSPSLKSLEINKLDDGAQVRLHRGTATGI
ncbi:hypothetical protein RQP46_002270 [Phenoliferia psychrophenolica]